MNTPITISHEQQIRAEITRAGITHLGVHRFTSSYLPRVIHPDEHIEAAIFGRHKESANLFGLVEGMLIATDERVIFINHHPAYTTMDEVSFDVISGISLSNVGLYASVTLFTKIANYTLSYVKPNSAIKFTTYIEERRIDQPRTKLSEQSPFRASTELTDDTQAFLATHELGVLSSIDRHNNVTGAAIYYAFLDGYPYFITKTSTRKAAGIVNNQHVALTVVDEANLQTVQIQGILEAEPDDRIKSMVSKALIKSRHYNRGNYLPPVIKLNGDTFVVFRIKPSMFSFSDYSKK